MRAKNIIMLMALLFFGRQMLAQVAIGEWRTHLPYQFSNVVMLTPDKAYCSSTGGLFYYNLNDNSIETLSKADGLSDNGLSTMAWSEEEQMALLAYKNANLDIIVGNDIINIPDIMKKQIPGDKAINHIYFLNHKAYLSCGFGIVVLDLKKFEIVEAYYIGDNGDQINVNQMSSDGTYLYAATEKGVRKAEISNPFLIDYNSWETISDLPDPDGEYTAVEYFGQRLFVVHHDPSEMLDIVYYYDATWNEYSTFTDDRCFELKKVGSKLLLSGDEAVRIMSEDFIFISEYLEGNPRSACLDNEGILWIADYGRGLVRVEAEDDREIRPNGPFSSLAYRLEDADGIVYAVSGGVTATYNNVFRPGIFMGFNEQMWRSSIKYTYQDLITLAVDPNDPTHVFAGSWGYGLAEYKDYQEIAIYNEKNSSLQNGVSGGNVVRIGGLAYDQDANLWMTNTGVAEPISVLKNDGTWKSFKANGILSGYAALGEIIMTDAGHMWGIIPKGGGLFAANFNGTIDNEDDDEYKIVSVIDENGNVLTNEVFSMAEDHDGNIWLGTNEGVLVYYSPEQLFSEGTVIAQRICIPRGDGTLNCDNLLKTEKITSIEVDGSNRKWLGTADGGAFLVSENGLKQYYFFNTSNSAILSNSILDICVEGKSGEVFFGTENGIISFRAEATEGADNFADIRIFPNPVRENYTGPIAIQGLMVQTTVKITDISGNIVKEIDSYGGQAVWDGTDFKGKRVATGVYLVFMADREATDAAVGKILFIH